MPEQPDAQKILEAARTSFSPTLEQAKLTGCTFMILGYRLVHTKYGERRVATIRLNGRDETVDAWLGGAVVDNQLKALSESNALPVIVKMTRPVTEEGNDPYVLEYASDAERKSWESTGGPTPVAPGPIPEPGTFKSELAKLVEFCRENDLCHDSGNVNSAKVLDILGLPVGTHERAADVFKDYRNAIWQEKKCSEDETYRFILQNLKDALNESEHDNEVPFE